MLVGVSDSFETLAIALFGVGLFAAIYHPVGTPMVVDAAVVRGRTMAFNGICGNIGVSIASGCTARDRGLARLALSRSSSRLWSSSCPGFAYLTFVPDDRGKRVVQAPDQDVALSKRLTIAVVVMFLHARVLGRASCSTRSPSCCPSWCEQRVASGISLSQVGVLATAVFLCGGMAQFAMGRAVERVVPHLVMSCIAGIQVIGILLALYTSGWWLLPSLALAVAAIYGQVTVNDLVLARYAPPAVARAHLCDPLLPHLHDGGARRVGHRPALRSGRLQYRARRRRRDRGARRAQYVRDQRAGHRRGKPRAAQQREARAGASLQPAE